MSLCFWRGRGADIFSGLLFLGLNRIINQACLNFKTWERKLGLNVKKG